MFGENCYFDCHSAILFHMPSPRGTEHPDSKVQFAGKEGTAECSGVFQGVLQQEGVFIDEEELHFDHWQPSDSPLNKAL